MFARLWDHNRPGRQVGRPALGLEVLEDRAVPAVSLAGNVLTITGTPGADNIQITGNATSVTVTGSVTDTVVLNGVRQANTAAWKPVTITADLQDVIIDTGAGSDFVAFYSMRPGVFLFAELGDGADHFQMAVQLTNDTLVSAGAGNDYVFTGAGIDVVDGLEGDDHIFLNGGDDIGLGFDGNDHIDGGDGADVLFGEDGTDHLFGGAGPDELYDGDGWDYLNGGPGNGADTFFATGDQFNDVFDGGPNDPNLPDRVVPDGVFGSFANNLLLNIP